MAAVSSKEKWSTVSFPDVSFRHRFLNLAVPRSVSGPHHGRSRVAQIADLAGQLVGRKGLLQEGSLAIEQGRPAMFAFAVTGDKQHLEVGIQGLELCCQLRAVHFRYDDVRDEQVEPRGVRPA